MIKVALVGTGNLAFQLYKALLNCPEIELVGVFGRNQEALSDFEQVLTTTEAIVLPAADLSLIAVSDDAIARVSMKMEPKHGLLAHTSGAQAIGAIKSDRAGVFYPLQTFSKQAAVDFSEIPICIEAKKAEDLELLKKLAHLLSDRVQPMNSADRKYLHLAAVYVNNFVNQLYQTAFEIVDQRELPFNLLYPLIKETARKVRDNVPAKVQTGPAKRNDTGIISKHLELQNPDNKELYTLLTQAIQNSQKQT